MKTRYNITKEEDFLRACLVFGKALRSVAPTAGESVVDFGKTLFHPFQIAALGTLKSGKSSLIKIAAREATRHDLTSEIIEKVSSYDQTRQITIAAQWLTRDFEIRAEDNQAIAALPSVPKFLSQDFNGFGIRFFEHAGNEVQGFCPLTFKIEGDPQQSEYKCLMLETSGENVTANLIFRDMQQELGELIII